MECVICGKSIIGGVVSIREDIEAHLECFYESPDIPPVTNDNKEERKAAIIKKVNGLIDAHDNRFRKS